MSDRYDLENVEPDDPEASIVAPVQMPEPSPSQPTNGSDPMNNLSLKPQHTSAARWVDIYFSCGIVFSLFWAIVGFSSHDEGGGWVGISAAVGLIGLMLSWLGVRLVMSYVHGRRGEVNSESYPGERADKRRAYLSFGLSIANIALLVVILSAPLLPDPLAAGMLMATVIGLPVVSFLSLIAITYGIKSLKTQYRTIGIWSLSMQGLIVLGWLLALALDSNK